MKIKKETDIVTRGEWQNIYDNLLNTYVWWALEDTCADLDGFEDIADMTLWELSEERMDARYLAEERGIDSWTIRELSNLHIKLENLPQVAEYALSGDWDSFSSLVQSAYQTMPEAFNYFYPDMPRDYRRDFVINCYVNHGDSVEPCRKAVIELPRDGMNELPREYRNTNELIVYRAGEEEAGEAPERISWTLSEVIARGFLDIHFERHAHNLYRAHIKPCDVIAYTNKRREQEVLQHRAVYDVETIDTADSGGTTRFLRDMAKHGKNGELWFRVARPIVCCVYRT